MTGITPPRERGQEQEKRKRGVCVFDLDGTIIDNSPRVSLAHRFLVLNDWLLAYMQPETIRRDIPVPAAVEAMKILAEEYDIIYLTNRTENTREETLRFLSLHGYPEGVLLMHPATVRFDTDYKPTRIRHLVTGGYDIKIIYDDEVRYINAYKEMGLPTYHLKDLSDWKRILANLILVREGREKPFFRREEAQERATGTVNYISPSNNIYKGMGYAMVPARADAVNVLYAAVHPAHLKGRQKYVNIVRAAVHRVLKDSKFDIAAEAFDALVDNLSKAKNPYPTDKLLEAAMQAKAHRMLGTSEVSLVGGRDIITVDDIDCGFLYIIFPGIQQKRTAIHPRHLKGYVPALGGEILLAAQFFGVSIDSAAVIWILRHGDKNKFAWLDLAAEKVKNEGRTDISVEDLDPGELLTLSRGRPFAFDIGDKVRLAGDILPARFRITSFGKALKKGGNYEIIVVDCISIDDQLIEDFEIAVTNKYYQCNVKVDGKDRGNYPFYETELVEPRI